MQSINEVIKDSLVSKMVGKLQEEVSDDILYHLTNAHKAIQNSDMYGRSGKDIISNIYNSHRNALMKGDMKGYHDSYDLHSGRHPDHHDELMSHAFESAGLDPDKATIDEFHTKVGLKEQVTGTAGGDRLDSACAKLSLFDRDNTAPHHKLVGHCLSKGHSFKIAKAAADDRISMRKIMMSVDPLEADKSRAADFNSSESKAQRYD